MSPLAVFFKTLSRTSALFLGTALVFLHPPLEWGRPQSLSAGKGPRQATIESLSLALRDPDAGVRRAVAEALDAYDAIDAQRAAVTELMKELSSADAATRARAACSLREIGAEAEPAVDALVAMLADDAPLPRSVCGERRYRNPWDMPTTPGERAAAALAKIGSKSVDPLIRTLKHTAPAARRNAAWALGAIGDRRAMDPLLPLLKDTDVEVRRQAVWAIGVVAK